VLLVDLYPRLGLNPGVQGALVEVELVDGKYHGELGLHDVVALHVVPLHDEPPLSGVQVQFGVHLNLGCLIRHGRIQNNIASMLVHFGNRCDELHFPHKGKSLFQSSIGTTELNDRY
jgi:hypothetical protein